jgi:hypothetical protein
MLDQRVAATGQNGAHGTSLEFPAGSFHESVGAKAAELG